MRVNEYVMFGKAKAGELKGLSHLDALARSRVTPFLDIPRRTGMSAAELGRDLVKTAQKIARHCETTGIFVDHFDVPLNVRAPAGVHPLSLTLRTLHDEGVHAVPVFGFDRDDAYFNAVAAILERHDTELCIRLLDDDMEDPRQTVLTISELLTNLGLRPGSMHIALDFRSLIQKPMPTLLARALNVIAALQPLGIFASMTVAGSNFPRNVTPIPADNIGYVERRELQLWERLRLAVGRQIPLHFGDYATVHPDFVDVESTRNANAKIRYTANTNWMIARGHMLREPPGYAQYHDLARIVTDSPEFLGADFSWGDDYIQSCADGIEGPGNLAKWVEVDICHHVSYVTQDVTARVATLA